MEICGDKKKSFAVALYSVVRKLNYHEIVEISFLVYNHSLKIPAGVPPGMDALLSKRFYAVFRY